MVVSIIALLIGILLPAIGKARDKARVTTSVSNLRQLAVALNAYAGDREDSQVSMCRYNISAYGSMANYNEAIGADGSLTTGHPPLISGWSGGGLWALWPSQAGHYFAVEAINFPGGPNPDFTGFGWFRMPNRKVLSSYVNGKFFDKVYWAPKDPTFTLIEPCLDQPGEFAPHFGCNGPQQVPHLRPVPGFTVLT